MENIAKSRKLLYFRQQVTKLPRPTNSFQTDAKTGRESVFCLKKFSKSLRFWAKYAALARRIRRTA